MADTGHDNLIDRKFLHDRGQPADMISMRMGRDNRVEMINSQLFKGADNQRALSDVAAVNEQSVLPLRDQCGIALAYIDEGDSQRALNRVGVTDPPVR